MHHLCATPAAYLSLEINAKYIYIQISETVLDTFIVEKYLHSLTKNRQEITPSSLQAFFVILHSSGDAL